MTSEKITAKIEALDYLLGKVSRYLKNNQYVYLRAFTSWKDGYNEIATELNTENILRVPIFKLGPADFSPTGKSIKMATVDKFVKTVRHQINRLEEKASELAEKEQQISALPPLLERYITCDDRRDSGCPPGDNKQIFVALPAGDKALKRYQQGIYPVLEAWKQKVFLANQPLINEEDLGEICRQLYLSQQAVFDLAGQASHVMFALGLAYGLGKQVLVLQPQGEQPITAEETKNHCAYTGPDNLRQKLDLLIAETRAEE